MAVPSWASRGPNAGMQALQAALGNLSFQPNDAPLVFDLPDDPLNASASVTAFRSAVTHSAAAAPFKPSLEVVAETASKALSESASAVAAPIAGAPIVEIGAVTVDENQPARRSFSQLSLAPEPSDRRPSISISKTSASSASMTSESLHEADDDGIALRNCATASAAFSGAAPAGPPAPTLSTSEPKELLPPPPPAPQPLQNAFTFVPVALHAPVRNPDPVLPDSVAVVVRRCFYTILQDRYGYYDEDYQTSGLMNPVSHCFDKDNDRRSCQRKISLRQIEKVREVFQAIPGCFVFCSKDERSLELSVNCGKFEHDQRYDVCTCPMLNGSLRDNCPFKKRAKRIADLIAESCYFFELHIRESNDCTSYHLLSACTDFERLDRIKGRLWNVSFDRESTFENLTVLEMGDLLRQADEDEYNFSVSYPPIDKMKEKDL